MKQMKHCNKNEKILNRKTGKHNEKRMEKITKIIKKTYFPKKTLHNSDTPNHFHKSRIILEKLYTIADPPTNQDPTLPCLP